MDRRLSYEHALNEDKSCGIVLTEKADHAPLASDRESVLEPLYISIDLPNSTDVLVNSNSSLIDITAWFSCLVILQNTQCTRLVIYSVHSVWFRFAIYKNAVFFFCTLALSAAATVANIKIHYDAKTPQFAIFGTRVICVFYSIREVDIREMQWGQITVQSHKAQCAFNLESKTRIVYGLESQ